MEAPTPEFSRRTCHDHQRVRHLALLGPAARSPQWGDLGAFAAGGCKDLPAIYSHSADCGPLSLGAGRLKGVSASRKLLIMEGSSLPRLGDNFIIRQGRDNPPVFMAGGHLCLPHDDGWLVVRSPNVTRVLDDAKTLVRMHGLKCPTGHPMTARSGTKGLFIGCENYPLCEERESFSLLYNS